MPYDDPDDDAHWSGEDWSDEEGDELDEEEVARCPECGGLVAIITDKCPSCGYWLSDKDRRAMWSSMQKPCCLRVTAWLVLAAFLLSLLVGGLTLF